MPEIVAPPVSTRFTPRMADEPRYRATTRGIQVTVTPRFLAERSSVEDGRFFWAYTIEIVNKGSSTVQLRSRHWKITDAHGQQQEVRGPGVVGEQPVLNPGDRFEYTSGVPLTTPTGLMVGTYEMVTEGGERFDVAVPAFSLDSPHGKRVLH
jgi:ApaG protein